jgi:hypothetical protein
MVASVYSHERRTVEDKCDYHFHASQLIDIGFSRGAMYALEWRDWLAGRRENPPDENKARRSEHHYATKHFARQQARKRR